MFLTRNYGDDEGRTIMMKIYFYIPKNHSSSQVDSVCIEKWEHLTGKKPLVHWHLTFDIGPNPEISTQYQIRKAFWDNFNNTFVSKIIFTVMRSYLREWFWPNLKVVKWCWRRWNGSILMHIYVKQRVIIQKSMEGLKLIDSVFFVSGALC